MTIDKVQGSCGVASSDTDNITVLAFLFSVFDPSSFFLDI